MSSIDPGPTIRCPNCQENMQNRDLERNDHGVVRVELCFACAGFWFDHLASVQLAPAAVIELFKEIHSQQDTGHQSMASRLGCPRCGDALTLSFDLCKSGRFSYFRCPRGDGRFTPFFQFLREKQFVRNMTPVELQRVRSQVRQIRCSECGAPIDLEHFSECQYCHSPVALLDPDAVEKAVRMWSDAESRRHLGPTPEALTQALQHTQLHHADPTALPSLYFGRDPTLVGADLGLDLVAMGIHAIGRLFEGGR